MRPTMELPNDWRKALTAFNTRLRDVTSDVTGRGLDKLTEDLEDLVVSVWTIENQGVLRHAVDDKPVVNRFADAFTTPLHRIAPPPPKKIKLNAPMRKGMALSEAGAVRGIDAIMLIRALVEIGNYTNQPDKHREQLILIMDDWRRLLFESAKITSFDKFRQLAAGEPPWASRIPHVRFARKAIIQLLEAVAKWRADKITPVPSVSMIACQGCGRFDGRERVRCHVCQNLYCGKCLARTAELCLSDYVVRYRPLSVDTRTGLESAARGVCKSNRLDEFTRNAAFVRALAESGVNVVFQDQAASDGEESTDNKGKITLRVPDRENATTKKALFSAFARCHLRSNELDLNPEHIAYYVDTCLGMQIEQLLKNSQPPATENSPLPIPSSQSTPLSTT